MSEAPLSARLEVTVNGEIRRVAASSLRELLEGLGRDPDGRGFAVAVNELVVPRGDWARVRIRPGDRIEIVGAVQGG